MHRQPVWPLGPVRAILLAIAAACLSLPAIARDDGNGADAIGPMITDLAPDAVVVWIRVPVSGSESVESRRLRCSVVRADAVEGRTVLATPDEDSDGTARFAFAGLRAGTEYGYKIQRNSDGAMIATGTFRTPVSTQGTARIVFGSCADIDAATAETWRAVASTSPDALVLIGDTPYIDSTDLAKQRARYRAFAAQPDFAALVARTPLHSVWDDHDFGANDTDGNLAGKENSRRAFVEYRAAPNAGDGQRGIYSSFRRGPVEVFLLDTRWFARTEPARGDAALPSLLGEAQWRWLEERLAASTAPVKVIASSMTFHDLASPTKKDHWGSYPHEFARLARFLGEKRIGGVLLVSGDIHRSRIVRHATAATAGVDLVEFTTSPLHSRAFGTAKEGVPGMEFDVGEPKSFLVIEAVEDAGVARVVASIRNAKGDTLAERRIESASTVSR